MPFQQAESAIGDQRQQSGWDCTGKDQAIIDGRDTAKNQLAQTSGTDCGSDGCNSDTSDGGGAKSCKDE
jgi:hypothetical protein